MSTTYIDEYLDRYLESEEGYFGSDLSRSWSLVRERKESPEEVVRELLRIKGAVKNLLLIHGVPSDLEISLASLGDEISGLAKFKCLETFEGPQIVLDKNIYVNHDPSVVMDLYCAVGLHEADHINNTRKFYHRWIDGIHNDDDKMKNMWENLLEDERIEKIGREQSPGFVGYYHTSKVELFEKRQLGEALRNWEKLPDMDKVSVIIFCFLRCPYLFTSEHREWTTVEGVCVYAALEGLLPSMPETEEEVEKYAQFILNFWKALKKEYDRAEKKGSERYAKEKTDAIECTEEERKERKATIHKKVVKHKLSKQEDKEYNEKIKDIEDKLDKLSKVDSVDIDTLDKLEKDAGKVRRHKLEASKKKLKKNREGKRFNVIDIVNMLEVLTFVSESLSTEEAVEVAKATEDRLEFCSDWVLPESGWEARKITKRQSIILHPRVTFSTVSLYNEIKREVQSHVAAMKKVFQFRLGTQTYIQAERKEGKLHRRQLARSFYTDRVFTSKYTKTDQGIALCLVLDESGSMGSALYGSRKARKALQVAVLLAESLKNVVGVELEVYSYSSYGRLNENNKIKYLFGKNNSNIKGIGNFTGGAQNYDHVAYEICGDLFLKNTVNSNRLMIVLSDGAPVGYYYGGSPAVEATRKQVEILEKRKNIKVLNVAIEAYRSEDIFKHTLKFTDLSQLVLNMRKLVTKIVRANSERVG